MYYNNSKPDLIQEKLLAEINIFQLLIDKGVIKFI